MKKLCFVLVIFSLFAAACGGEATVDTAVADAVEETSDDDTSTGEEEPEAAFADDDADLESGLEPATDDEPEPTSVEEPEPAPTVAPATSGSSSLIPAETLKTILDTDDWCTAAAAVEEGTGVLDIIDFTNPVELEEGYRGAQALVAASQRLVPDEIAADVQQSIVGFSALTAALEEAEWSFLDLDLSVIESLDTDMELATYNIELYNYNECAIGSDPGEPPVPSEDLFEDSDLPIEGTIRDQAVQGIIAEGFTEAEAGCIVDGLDFSDPEALADVSAIIGVFTECDIPLDRLAEIGG